MLEGYLDDAEFDLLVMRGDMAQHAIVEIGSYRGKSTVALATLARVPVYAIDPHEPFIAEDGTYFDGNDDRAAWLRNLLETHAIYRVRLVNLPAVQVARGWDRPIDLLWIDGNHREDAVCADVRAWMNMVVPGGYILLHDIHLSGVQAAMQIIEANQRFERVNSAVPIAQYRRRDA